MRERKEGNNTWAEKKEESVSSPPPQRYNYPFSSSTNNMFSSKKPTATIEAHERVCSSTRSTFSDKKKKEGAPKRKSGAMRSDSSQFHRFMFQLQFAACHRPAIIITTG